jgi:hypothetical protein
MRQLPPPVATVASQRLVRPRRHRWLRRRGAAVWLATLSTLGGLAGLNATSVTCRPCTACSGICPSVPSGSAAAHRW